MRKIFVIVTALIVLFFISNFGVSEEIIIPNESIRIRVVANSNSMSDQLLKNQVKESIQLKLNNLLYNVSDINEARDVLNSNLDDIKNIIEQTINSDVSNNNFKVNFGYNYFPEKKYKGVVYQEGYYESLVINLGSSEGNNWWCVLFPPLCLVDENSNNMENVEYKSFIKELIEKYF